MSDEKTAEKKPGWEKREFAINGKMRDMLNLGITSTKEEIEILRKKIKRLQYGGR